jgi:hypothetical protein
MKVKNKNKKRPPLQVQIDVLSAGIRELCEVSADIVRLGQADRRRLEARVHVLESKDAVLLEQHCLGAPSTTEASSQADRISDTVSPRTTGCEHAYDGFPHGPLKFCERDRDHAGRHRAGNTLWESGKDRDCVFEHGTKRRVSAPSAQGA